MIDAKQSGELLSEITPARILPVVSSRRIALLGLMAVLWSIGELSVAAPPAEKSGKIPAAKAQAAQTKPAVRDKAQEADEAAATDDNANADDKENRDAPENPFPRRIKAPDLDGGNGWLNAAGEITLKDLRGKVVVLDFWTFCCINCMHVLPDLAYLEKKYDKQLVVIGVHSAKFANEKETENIRRAIMRYEISHPVINDSEMTLWRKFGVSSWPSLVLIDPEGYYCGSASGEGNRELLDKVIEKVVAY
ncbi:MAG TPA: thioredoxin-like domain-containing protein, partial [Pirellulaceae bacterium]|nr:thioredoxin-like domain-containing protein [Pirellulaceae bacterium]